MTHTPLPPTGPYVERIIRIFRDHPYDDATAMVLQDYARAASVSQAPREVIAWCGRDHKDGRVRYTSLERVSEIWRDQGLGITPLYAVPVRASDALVEQDRRLAEWRKERLAATPAGGAKRP